MCNAYILQLVDGSYYVGSTKDLENRLKLHSQGKVRSTKGKLPMTLIYQESFDTYPEARQREFQIKRWKSRLAIERLISQQKHGPIV